MAAVGGQAEDAQRVFMSLVHRALEQSVGFPSFREVSSEELRRLPHRCNILCMQQCRTRCGPGRAVAVLEWFINLDDPAAEGCHLTGPFTRVMQGGSCVPGTERVKVWRTLHSVADSREEPGDCLVHSAVLCSEIEGPKCISRWGCVEMDVHRLLLLGVGALGAAADARALAAEKVRVLAIGCGFGSVAMILARSFPAWDVHAVDIEPAVLEVAAQYGGLDSSAVHLHEADAAEWLQTCEMDFDVMLLDANDCGFAPAGLTAEDFLRLMRKRLRPGGVLSQNAMYPDDEALQRQLRPLRTVFADVPTHAVKSAKFSQTICVTALPGRRVEPADVGLAELRAGCDAVQSEAQGAWDFQLSGPLAAGADQWSVMTATK
eukprot:TRINITY_DN43423_c0_g1_i1.p1 TRINITY_DN43423_c0_g1~~TRINITY_DN43423_c0_g1_i1.p1  ORF type:complete len:376 (+),score=93.60 TRINITY_DN43423_c0_g1_i1:61-1188(+)